MKQESVKRYFVSTRTNFATHAAARAKANELDASSPVTDRRIRVRRRANDTFDVVVKTPQMVAVS